ncbi:MAG: LysR substrate-binding domain-containing protein [Pseudomonadota bacterium]
MNAPLIPGSMRFEIDVLKTFIAVADTGSVKLASERVARSSAAVSMQMKKLENLVGSPVFQRAEGAMRLSAVGERLMPHAHRIVQANDTAIAEMQSPGIEGVVRVGICLENAETRMPEILAGFSQAHSGVTVEIVSGDAQDLAAMLTKDELDIAILTVGGGAPPEERDRLLHEQPLVWATHVNGHRNKERPLRLAVASVGCPWRLAALDALKRAGIPYRIAYLSNVSESQLAAVRADLAVAALPLSRVTNCNQSVCVNEDLPELPYTQIVLRTTVNPGENTKALAVQVLSAFNRPR